MSSDRRDPLHRFSNRVADYIRYRPGYAPELLPWVRANAGISESWRVADIGSGTGLLSREFLSIGCTVYGVEPNDEMRAAAEHEFARERQFHSVKGTAENTTLPDRSFQLVSAGQAFHWFDPPATRREWHRIVAPEGYALVVFNSRLHDATPFMRAYDDYLIVNALDYDRVDHLRGLRTKLETVLDRYEEMRFAFTLRHRYDDVRGLSMSSSYVPPPGHPRHGAFFMGLTTLFDQHAVNGIVEFAYETEAYLSRLGTA